MTNPITRFGDRYPILIQIITWMMRIFLGILFIYSGFTKGIDPWGTIFKFREYFSVWGFDVWDALNIVGVFILCLVEFLTGCFLILGCFRRATPVIALLIMAFMLPLTLWLAVKNPIDDCGCFGDALKLTNWETFYKNVVITIGAIWLVIFNKRAMCLITPYLQWIASIAAGLYLLIIAWLGYYYQPLIDFRPYHTGTELVEHDADAESGDDEDQAMRFVYEKDGVEKEFTIDEDLPSEEDGWKFVRRYIVYPEDGETPAEEGSIGEIKEKQAKTKNLRLYTEDGHEDVTEEVVGEGRQLLLMIPVLSEVSAAKTWKINSFYDWCKENDIDMLAAVGGNPKEIKDWKDISQAEYPIYTSDDTAIEEVVRGNPGIVYIEDGIIKWKSSLKAIDIDDFQKPDITKDPMNFARDDKAMLYHLTWLLLIIEGALVVLTLFPKLLITIFRKKKKDDEPDRRMQAEWENPERIMLALPNKDTDWNYILAEAIEQYRKLLGALANGGEKIMLICQPTSPAEITALVRQNGGEVIEDIDYNDTWTRDYGPLTVEKEGEIIEIDFGFNGWGLKFAADKDNLVNLHLEEKGYRKADEYRNDRDFVLEGGSIETDGKGTILTTSRCLCSPNRNGGKGKDQIEKILKARLGARKVLWLDYGFLEGDDTDSHIDTLARMAPGNAIIYVAPPEDKDDIHHEELIRMEQQLKELRTLDGKEFKLIALPFPDAIYDEEGHRLPATYANYLVTEKNIYVPTYGQEEKDNKACEAIQSAFPEYKLHTVDCRTLIKQHGSLHCSTIQLYK